MRGWTPSRFLAIFLQPAGTASNKAQQLLFPAHRGPSAGQGQSGGGLETRRNKRLIFLNLGRKLITLFNKRPISPVLVLFILTFLCLFDMSLTVLCTGTYGIGVLCDRNDQRVPSTIHSNRRLWNGQTRKGDR